jgi:hypothetical protein
MTQQNHHGITSFNIAGVNWESNPHIPIISVEQLRTLLATLSEATPGIVELESAEKDRLQLGIGGSFACAQFIKRDNMPPYLLAQSQIVRAKKDAEFLLGGTPTPIAPEHCLSFEEALQIAEHFFNTGGRDPNIKWVEV